MTLKTKLEVIFFHDPLKCKFLMSSGFCTARTHVFQCCFVEFQWNEFYFLNMRYMLKHLSTTSKVFFLVLFRVLSCLCYNEYYNNHSTQLCFVHCIKLFVNEHHASLPINNVSVSPVGCTSAVAVTVSSPKNKSKSGSDLRICMYFE